MKWVQEGHISVSYTHLDDSEVDTLVKEAAKHAEEDKKNKESVETKIEAESLIFQVEKFVEEMKDKFTDEEKEELKKKADELKEIISKDTFDITEVKDKTKELSTKLQEKGAEMYKRASEDEKKTSDEASNKKDEDEKKENVSDNNAPEEGEVIDKDW